MILTFSQYFDKKQKQKQTFFAEKINACLRNCYSPLELDDLNNNMVYFYSKFDENIIPKKHTIRLDKKNRWKVGNKIHAVYNSRTKSQHQIAPVFECKGIQDIEITYNHGKAFVIINNKSCPAIWIHDFKSDYVHPNILEIAINDGFDNLTDFFNWFNTDFKGKIIHFTNFRYGQS